VRIFLDTNVLASALATRGLCADLLHQLLLAHTLVISSEVLAELERVLFIKFGAPPEIVWARPSGCCGRMLSSYRTKPIGRFWPPR
jgi:hypothetical protein